MIVMSILKLILNFFKKNKNNFILSLIAMLKKVSVYAYYNQFIKVI